MMKKYLCVLILVVVASLTSFANAEEITFTTYSFTEIDIGNIRITIDQWGDWFWDIIDVFDDLVEEI